MKILTEPLRKRLGLNRREFAEEMGVTDTFIYMIETGRAYPSLPFLEKIAIKYEVSIRTLITD